MNTQNTQNVQIKQRTQTQNGMEYLAYVSYEYSKVRYQQELDLAEFKLKQDSEIKPKIIIMMEEGVSKRRLDLTRSLYIKTLELNEDEASSLEDKINGIYDLLIEGIGTGSKASYTRRICTENEKLIKEYYHMYFIHDEELKDFREKQRDVIKELTNDIKGEGVAPSVLTYVYKRFKTDVSLIESSSADEAMMDSYSDVYTDFRKQILQDFNLI